ncbi:MAG TPA: hypothetical protein VGN72_19990 [Tepidisphaeraceae bacterium]|jgi:hypothetical protein|nr:hypothetical protein [Tepidisphaeraceae bacterium]
MSEQRADDIILEAHAKFMAEAFARLLGDPTRGTVTFVRCLSREVIEGLCGTPAFQVAGWDIRAVVESADPARRYITADLAVELREDKGDVPLLLLVDPSAAGAGMDGIYNASREIKEAELFDEAGKVAAKSIKHGWTSFARTAVRYASRLGGRRGVSPWREFDFLTRCALSTADIGQSLARLGLWPIKLGNKPNQDDLGLSAVMVEKLLLGGPGGRSPQARIDALMLDDLSPQTRATLERFVRDAASRPLDDAVRELEGHAELWLNEVRLATAGGRLQAIQWVTWRGKNGSVGKWCGLIDHGEGLPHFVMDPDAATAKQLSRLEIRWNTQPVELGRSTVEYRVTVLAGEDELAEKTVSHAERSPQRIVFTNEDFNDLDEDARFEARVRITAVGAEGVEPAESDEFLLYFGQEVPSKGITAGAGKPVRAAVEGAITLLDAAAFDDACSKEPAELFSEDKKGYVLYRPQPGRGGFKVPRPPLLKAVEESWALNPESVGRWVVRVRADGSPVGGPTFVELEPAFCPEDLFDRLRKASKRFCDDVMRGPGAVAKVYCGQVAATEEYVNAWSAALDKARPEASLSHTVEVQSLSGRTIGLVVLPTHPLRVSWHMAYDQLARHARYESNTPAADVRDVLATLDSAHFPSLLPGLAPGYSFVFGDTLGFHAVAMVRDDDNEPKAAISQIAACLAKDQPELAPSVGAQAAEVLAREVRKYVDHHSIRRLLHVHALRPGDGMTLGRALGKVAEPGGLVDDSDAAAADVRQLGFVVELFTAEVERGQTGRFFTEVVERRRSGAGGLDPRDRWMLESMVCEGGISLPRLRWAKREQALPDRAAHLAVAFDTFESRVEAIVLEGQAPRPAQAYGLVAQPERRWTFTPTPTWVSFQPPLIDGEKHPAGKVLTDRMLRLQRVVLQAVAAHRGGDAGAWPALVTRLSPERRAALTRLHHLSDWVVTVDRNAGVEYFDSPHEAGAVYDTYVIDCVPERDDLGNLQLITSTVRVDEVQDLLNETLGQMGLSSNPSNCRFLLSQLKALSGRLAIRLTNRNAAAGELVALAAVYANCLRAEPGSDDWLGVQQGFFVPLDDVRDLHPVAARRNGQGDDQDVNYRADLLFVTAAGRGGLRLCFVEVKYRRHLGDAGDPGLVRDVVAQATGTARRWQDWYFDPSLPELTQNLRRGRLARAIRFYADKARRHDLSDEAHQRLVAEIDKMVRTGSGYAIAAQPLPNRGYIFCPEFASDVPKELPVGDGAQCRVFVFGPNVLPELAGGTREPARPQTRPTDGPATVIECAKVVLESSVSAKEPSAPESQGAGVLPPPAGELPAVHPTPAAIVQPKGDDPTPAALEVVLGDRLPAGDPVVWPVSIRSNPHLMVVGLPGMGKTTCLVNICRQFAAAGVTPVVFSYHQDLDEKLAESLDGVRFLDHGTLGFNPLRVGDARPTAYVDNAGMMRDIFSAIFPEMGDIQTGKLRTAIKESYEALGWGPGGPGSATPSFRDFYLRLKSEEKPDRGLLARLGELDDYGVFSGTGDGRRLLDDVAPAVVQIHANQNELIQRAFASLILYGIYKDMFRRGPQGRLTHAVIFDEAHRASKLRLLPTMAKECRKYGISLVLASQEARDFDDSLYSAVANYLSLRVTENDAKTIARHCVEAELKSHTADRLKALSKYEALFFAEGKKRPVCVALKPGE